MTRLFLAACLAASLASILPAQTAARKTAAHQPESNGADLKYVVYFSRHGVRSPTGKSAQYDQYSSAPWPTWNVAPGILTPHGFHLMEIFGAYDRTELAKQGLFAAEGCADASKVSFYADSDQRTRETGKALAKGMFPGCDVPVPALPEGTNDPLFHLPAEKITAAESELAKAAIAGRIGGDPARLTDAYRPELAALDHLLETCGKTAAVNQKRTSLLDIPATLSAGQGDHLADLKGPLNTAATLTENLLLEYTEGMDAANVGWGCGDGPTIRSLIAIHTAASDFTQRTPAVAKLQAANLLEHIRMAMEQAVEQRPVKGSLGKSTDRALFLIGHDTNLSNMAGALNLTWIEDGRRDDTPPGSTLIFELWKRRTSGAYEVKVYFTAQTLEQMRLATPLSLETPPQRVPVFIPGCSGVDFACSWPSFSQAMRQAAAGK